ncbi:MULTISPECIES: hypothetical protein [unclassified Mesorhizobium]|uniref:hypothetical protein n=1 Tax=unclassified Mesorhizobium TaxID=325217 RepID=UPI00112DBA45|nr:MULTISPECIES: hypothetical protein [unclassified Mesorhizobium]TPJ70489.1 hypothetical protein FJ462_07285 [Mesorhizobium sp. B2-6-7]TPJ76854.1 hypothetical protein FJ422_29535 [Mesorhizobium sp. B2-6-3]
MVPVTGKERPMLWPEAASTEARFETASLHQIREHVLSLKVWVEHWQADRLCNLVPTESSLILAKAQADRALALVERIEASQRETV